MESKMTLLEVQKDFVYPGHPVVIAYMVTQKYPSFEEAVALGRQYPRALEDSDIFGAGGSVYAALDLLQYVQKGVLTLDAFIERADKSWGDCDNHARDAKRHDRWQNGLAQAKKVLPHLLKTGWLEAKEEGGK